MKMPENTKGLVLGRKEPLKRQKTPNEFEGTKHRRKRFDNKKIQDVLPPNTGNDTSSEEGDTCSQLPMYDNLLRTFKSDSDVTAYLYNMRQSQHGDTIDSKVDDSTESELAIGSEEKGDEAHEIKWKEGVDVISDGIDFFDQDDNEISERDDICDFETGDCMLSDGTTEMSSFHHHFGHVLVNDEAQKLKKQKIIFKWEMPAKEMTMSMLVGTGEDISMELNSDPFCGINHKLYSHWENLSITSIHGDSFSSKRKFFFSLCNTYRDIMYCDKKPFYLKGKEDSSMMDAYIMHVLNHIHKTRDLVLKNDSKLKKNEGRREEVLHGDIYLDQGFTRPKVMILLPLASIAFRVVKRLVHLFPLSHKGNVSYMDRFSEDFGSEDVIGEDRNVDGSLELRESGKPIDFQALFGGNNNDHFMMGIKITKKSLKFYSNFYSSDIIVASPLGLITKIGELEVEKEKDVDYLSSIEVLIIDHADVITMQNLSHVNTVIEHLNLLPSKQHGTDVMRIKKWYLDGHAPFYRQTILLGSLLTPDLNALFNRFCVNYEGKLKLISKHKGVLHQVLLQVRQVYERFDAPSIVDADDARLEYFCKKVFPKIKDSLEGGALLFISSYFEFVRIRNFLKSQNASFCLLAEYTKQSDVSRSRLWFFEGKRKIMLYTERAHFYHRYKIRGIKNLIIYSLPERKEFYPEIVNMLEESTNKLCTVLFSRFDLYRLERIVGNSAARRMTSSDKSTFIFC